MRTPCGQQRRGELQRVGGHDVVVGEAMELAKSHDCHAVSLIGEGRSADAVLENAREQECDLIVLGDAGKNFANYLIRGNVYIRGEWESLGNNTSIIEMDESDTEKLNSYFNSYGIEADPQSFKKIVAASKKPFYK